MAEPTSIDKLKSMFSIGMKTDKKTKATEMFPVTDVENRKGETKKKKVKIPDSIQGYYDYWLASCADNNQTLKSRFDRYSDFDYMYYNSTVISRAVHLYADEVTQSDAVQQPITVTSESTKLTKYIYGLLDQWGFTPERLYEIAFNIVLYGDAFTINNITDKGVEDVTLLDVRAVQDRVEFSLNHIKDEQNNRHKGGYSYNTVSTRNTQLQAISDVIKSKEGIGNWYKDYLFGFQLERDLFTAPWSVSHYRLINAKSEFYPYGRPLLINCIAPFRKWMATETLVATARSAKFPKEKYEITVDDSMTPLDKWNAVNEAKEEFYNVNQSVSDKEQFGIGGQIWTVSDLLDYNLIENSMRLDDIADLEMLKKNLIAGTGVPISFLDVDNGNFGSSGTSLVYQYKPFGRSVYKIQSIILNEIVQLVKIHLTITEDFDADSNFNISMPFPILEESSDRMRAKSDSFRLAKDIIDGLGTAIGLDRGEALPFDIVKDILGTHSYLTPDEIMSWEKMYKKDQAKVVEEKKIKESIDDELLESVYMDSFRNLKMNEGVLNGSHYINSTALSQDHKIQLEAIKSLKGKKKTKLHETAVKYKK